MKDGEVFLDPNKNDGNEGCDLFVEGDVTFQSCFHPFLIIKKGVGSKQIDVQANSD